MSGNGHTKTATLRIERFNPDIDERPAFEELQVELVPGKTILDALLEGKTVLGDGARRPIACWRDKRL